MTPADATAVVLVAASITAWAIVAAARSSRAARAAQRALTLSHQEHLDRVSSMETSDRLAADLAHDLDDLLTAIVGHAELLMVSMDPAAPGLPEAREIFELAAGGARLTRPLRSLDSQATSRAAPSEARGSRGAAVLVVDDEPGVRELIRSVLTRAGHDVVAADGPRAALAALSRLPAVALMIVDLVMPEMDGYDLVAEARGAAPGLAVIFISGFAPDAKRQSPGDRFLAKPFTAGALTAMVREALTECSARPRAGS